MGKIIQFLMEVKSELWKVVWPTRAQTLRYSVIVIVSSLIIAVILGAADYGLIQALERAINK